MSANNTLMKFIVPSCAFFIVFLAINYFFMTQGQNEMTGLIMQSVFASVLFGLLLFIFNKYKTSK